MLNTTQTHYCLIFKAIIRLQCLLHTSRIKSKLQRITTNALRGFILICLLNYVINPLMQLKVFAILFCSMAIP